MKGENILKILETLGDTAMDMADLFMVIMESGYGASYRKLQWGLSRRQRNRHRESIEKLAAKALKQRYYELLYKLRRDKLIEEETRSGKKLLSLTKKGKEKLLLLKSRLEKQLPPIAYQREEANKFTIIAFDIPEKQRRKRGWLRSVLKNLGLQMIQRSVWAGKVKIPRRFLDDLSQLKLLNFVEIFEISRTGSLKHIV